jgi:glycosyltransferase involved in cell wall biosynthesis
MESGGSERQMLQLLKGLNREKIQPHLYLTYGFGSLMERIPADVPTEVFADQDISHWAKIPGSLFAMQVRKLRRVLRSRSINVTYDRLYHTVMLGAIATRRLPVARVITVVSPPSQDFGNTKQRWMGIKRKLLSWSYGSATRLFAVSEDSAIDASKFYNIPIERWSIVPSPIDFASVVANSEATPPTNFIKHPGLNIVMLGRLSAEKNHSMMLKVISELMIQGKQTHLHIIGDGVLRDALKAEVNQLKLESNVTFYGVLANPHAIVGRCDVLCLPSLYEGFPNVVMEAMACRTPVIASSNAGGLRSLIGNNDRGWLLDPTDANAWQEIITSMIDRRLDTSSSIESACEYVREYHDLPAWIETMEQVFREASKLCTKQST